MYKPALPGFLANLRELNAHRDALIAKDGISAVADEIAAQLASVVLPSLEYVPLSGGFFFRHDGAGHYDLMHDCGECAYVLNPEHVDDETMSLFAYALDRDWLNHLIETVESQHNVSLAP